MLTRQQVTGIKHANTNAWEDLPWTACTPFSMAVLLDSVAALVESAKQDHMGGKTQFIHISEDVSVNPSNLKSDY